LTGTTFQSKVSILQWRTYIQHTRSSNAKMYPVSRLSKCRSHSLCTYPSSYSQRHTNCYSPPRRFGQYARPSNSISAAVLASAARFVGSRTTHLDVTVDMPSLCIRYRYCRLGSALGRESSTRSANSHLDSRFDFSASHGSNLKAEARAAAKVGARATIAV
jgi:hypothetical protein